MAEFKVEVRYSIKGHFIVEAKNPQEAVEFVEKHCSVSIGNVHTTLPDEDIDWDFPNYPE
jgi:hypothetical protein